MKELAEYHAEKALKASIEASKLELMALLKELLEIAKSGYTFAHCLNPLSPYTLRVVQDLGYTVKDNDTFTTISWANVKKVGNSLGDEIEAHFREFPSQMNSGDGLS